MSYPSYTLATLVQCGGTSCNYPNHVLGLISGLNRYAAIAGEGVFSYGLCFRVDLGGGQYTWHLRITYSCGGGACDGTWNFRRVTVADDPVGDYGLWTSGNTGDASAGQATVAQYQI